MIVSSKGELTPVFTNENEKKTPWLKAHKYTLDGQVFHGRIKMNDCYSNHQKSVKCSKGAFIEEIQPVKTDKSECANRNEPTSKIAFG